MYGALLQFDLTPSPENAERIAKTLAEAVKFVWRKVGGPTAWAEIDDQADRYVQQSARFYMTRLARTELPHSIDVSPLASQPVEWWPMVTTDGAALELRVKVTRHFSTNTPEYPLFLASRFQRLDICQFDPDEMMPPDPAFTREDFGSEKQFQQFIEMRNFFLESKWDQEKLYEWECRHEFDFWGWRDLWLNGGLMLIFNMSALAYLISALSEALPIASIEVDRGQIEGG